MGGHEDVPVLLFPGRVRVRYLYAWDVSSLCFLRAFTAAVAGPPAVLSSVGSVSALVVIHVVGFPACGSKASWSSVTLFF